MSMDNSNLNSCFKLGKALNPRLSYPRLMSLLDGFNVFFCEIFEHPQVSGLLYLLVAHSVF